MKIVIHDGTIVTSEKIIRSDIFIEKGRIVSIGTGPENYFTPDKIIDASGRFVFPGGIDPHVHMNLPSSAGYSSDDFSSGSRAALYGGTTTIIDFVTPLKGQSLTEALTFRKKEAELAHTDYSFHVSPVEWRQTTEHEIHECINEGITSFKVYMAYKKTIGLNDDDLHRVMQSVGKAGGIVTVHCESGDMIESLRDRLFEENRTGPEFHPLSRPSESESSAVKLAIETAEKTGCTLYIVHVSAKESLELIDQAQKKGQKIYAETCPQYLLLDDSKYSGPADEILPFIISPPLRKTEDREALWNSLANGTVKSVGTDHCPFMLRQKEKGLADFRKIPNGAGGVEHRLALLYTYGVLENRITINQLVDITATQPAKIFGLFPSKGAIAIGSDADLVVWNPDVRTIISSKTHHQNSDINIFENRETKGKAEYMILNGNLIIQNGEMAEPVSQGRFLKRKL